MNRAGVLIVSAAWAICRNILDPAHPAPNNSFFSQAETGHSLNVVTFRPYIILSRP